MSCECGRFLDIAVDTSGRMVNGSYHAFFHCSRNCTCEGADISGCLEHDPLERKMRSPAVPEEVTEPSSKEAEHSYKLIGEKIGALVEQKQAAYGDSFGKSGAVMRILYPTGISDAQLDDALTVVRVLDKLFRIATDRDALGESPWNDIAGYAILSVRRLQK